MARLITIDQGAGRGVSAAARDLRHHHSGGARASAGACVGESGGETVPVRGEFAQALQTALDQINDAVRPNRQRNGGGSTQALQTGDPVLGSS